MAFVTHEQAVERTIGFLDGERAERATFTQVLVAARMATAELRKTQAEVERLRADRAKLDALMPGDECLVCGEVIS